MDRPIVALLITLLATLAMVVPLGLSALSANQANAIAGQGETASRKPLLYKMLGYNDKIDSYQDELRMDFILRVRHNDFNPNCANATNGADTQGTCNLSFVYPFWGSQNQTWYRRIKYLNTIASASSTDKPWSGAYQWARNKEEYFTVHKIINSGLYDYLAISLEGDLNLRDKSSDSSYYRAGGTSEPLNIFAVVGQQQGALSCGSPGSPWNWNSGVDECGSFDFKTMINAPDRTSNITESLTANGKNFKLYMGDCLGSDANLQCSGPYSWIGWDDQPKLYGGFQANWGMVTDYGFPAYSDVDDGNIVGNVNGTQPGVAPARSFFVYWENPRGGNVGKGICSETTSYYYQWVGLKNNTQWVPVDDLTPEPILVEGQKPSPNTLTSTFWTQGTADSYSAFNLPKQPNNSNEMFATDKNGQPMPAQNADGSINFKKAKEDQDLDGYFKLVTWPVTKNLNDTGTDNNCNVNPEVYNPMRKGLAGIDDAMSEAKKD